MSNDDLSQLPLHPETKTRYIKIDAIPEKSLKKYWRRVDKGGPLPDQSNPHYAGLSPCWLWTGVVTPDGYGHFHMNGKTYISSRIAYAIANPDVDFSDLQVLHRCDQPLCQNSSHLFLGTHQDNMDDKGRKGRQSKGDNHGMAVYTDEQVALIRRLYDEGTHYKDIAQQMGLSPKLISDLCSRSSWRKHVPLTSGGKHVLRGTAHPQAELTDEQVFAMRQLAASGESYAEIARQFNVSYKQARSSCTARDNGRWRHLENVNTDTSHRARKGTSHYKAVLNPDLVMQMRRLHYVDGKSIRAVAAQFGHSPSTTYQAVSRLGNAWRDLPFTFDVEPTPTTL